MQSADSRQRREFLIELKFRAGAQQHQCMPRMLPVQEPQYLRPALVGPIFVVYGEPTRTAPHRALVADLHENQRLIGKTAGLQPSGEFSALNLPHLEITTWKHRLDVGARRRYRARHDLSQPPPLLSRMFARQQRVIFDIHNQILRDAGALEKGPCRRIAVAEPSGSRAAFAQLPHDPLLIDAHPVRRFAAAHAENVAYSRLSAQQRLAPGS